MHCVVDDSQDNRSPGTSVPDVANLGLIRPPFVYAGPIALGLVLHLLWPARLVPLRSARQWAPWSRFWPSPFSSAQFARCGQLARPSQATAPPQRSSARGPTASAETPSISPSRFFSSVSLCGSTVSPCCYSVLRCDRRWHAGAMVGAALYGWSRTPSRAIDPRAFAADRAKVRH